MVASQPATAGHKVQVPITTVKQHNRHNRVLKVRIINAVCTRSARVFTLLVVVGPFFALKFLLLGQNRRDCQVPLTVAHSRRFIIMMLRKKTANQRVSRLQCISGGAEGGRTPDLMTASHALSQLSYSPENMRVENTKLPKGVSTFICRLYNRLCVQSASPPSAVIAAALNLLTKNRYKNNI